MLARLEEKIDTTLWPCHPICSIQIVRSLGLGGQPLKNLVEFLQIPG
jgi:hypothetical protein